MEVEKTQISLKFEVAEKELFESTAEAMNLSLTGFLKKGAGFYTSLDPEFRTRMQTFAKDLGVTEFLVYQNLALSWFARREAEGEVFGVQDPLLEEFQFTGMGPVTGQALHRALKNKFVKEFESEKETRLLLAVSRGRVLRKGEQAFIKARTERVENCEEKQRLAQGNRAAGKVATFKEGEDEEKILAEMKAKRERTGRAK